MTQATGERARGALLTFLGDLLQGLGFTMVVMLLVHLGFGYLGYRLYAADGLVPGWYERFMGAVYVILPLVLFAGSVTLVRLMRRAGKTITAFRVTRVL